MTEPEFVRLQRALTQYLRDPETLMPPPGHEERRLTIYRHAIFANLDGFMTDNYPRVRDVTDETRWNAMLRDYLIRHVSTSTAFIDLPLEFLDYLERERDEPTDPAFLHELAHFDWLETLISADERRIDLTDIDRDGDLINGVPVANPILRVAAYRYPVHVIGPEYQPPEAPQEPTRIAAFRDLDNRYGFLDLSNASARLLELIVEAKGLTGREIFEAVAREMGQTDGSALITAGRSILSRMRDRAVILGTRYT